MFSGFAMIGILFMWVYIKETRGLTDKEKKEIFKPSYNSPLKIMDR